MAADDRPVMSESELHAAIAAVGRWFEQHPNYAEDAEAETEAAFRRVQERLETDG